MARRRREREPVETVDYTDHEGNVLTLRQSPQRPSIRKINKPHRKDASLGRRRLGAAERDAFEYLADQGGDSGLLSTQKMLIGRYRMADSDEQQWVRETITTHIERHIPELS
jgi:hypothetical protein